MVIFYQLAWNIWFPQHLSSFKGIANTTSFNNLNNNKYDTPKATNAQEVLLNVGAPTVTQFSVMLMQTFFKNCSITPIAMINGHTIFFCPMLFMSEGQNYLL